MTKAKKKLVAKKRQGMKGAKTAGKPSPYVLPRTAAELGIVCACGQPVVWFDYEIGERSHMQGFVFVCDNHKISTRIEKLAM
jgi:hypothetical protein